MTNRHLVLLRTTVITFGIIVIAATAALYFRHTVTRFDRAFILSDKREDIVATYVEWMCNCANFVELRKFKTDPVKEPHDGDYFFIEPATAAVPIFQSHTSYYVRLTGQFTVDEGIPVEFELGHIEDKPGHARIFKYEKIEYLNFAEISKLH